MITVTVEDAQARLPELLDGLTPGEAVLITRAGKPVAKMVSEPPWGVPVAGRCKGMLTILAEDDDHLADFAEYME